MSRVYVGTHHTLITECRFFAIKSYTFSARKHDQLDVLYANVECVRRLTCMPGRGEALFSG